MSRRQKIRWPIPARIHLPYWMTCQRTHSPTLLAIGVQGNHSIMNPDFLRPAGFPKEPLRPVSFGQYERARAKYARAVHNCCKATRDRFHWQLQGRDRRACNKWARVCRRLIPIIDAFNLNPNNKIDV